MEKVVLMLNSNCPIEDIKIHWQDKEQMNLQTAVLISDAYTGFLLWVVDQD